MLYTADSQFTALQEVEALFLDEAGGLRGVPRNPDLILTLECSLLSMLNLTDAGLLEQLGTSYEELIAESPSRFIENARGRSTPTQQLGSACFRSGHISAINAPSAANPSGFLDSQARDIFEKVCKSEHNRLPQMVHSYGKISREV